VPITVLQTDDESLDYEAKRAEAWAASHGPLRPGELPPDDFQLEDEDRAEFLKKFFDS
jgi:hypothetical protein